MLIFDRTQQKWAWGSGATVLLAWGFYWWTSSRLPNGPSGGSLPGLIFGIFAALMMVYAGLLGARRRLFPGLRVGSASFWLRSHLWIGTLSVPFALFHAGIGNGHWYGGPLEIGLWILFFAVILSGFWGLALQNILPKLMLENVSRETFVQQIPHLCARFTARSDEAVAKQCRILDVSAKDRQPLSHLGIALLPAELTILKPHLSAAFKEDGKTYSTNVRGETEAEQFNRFLSLVYRVEPSSNNKPAGPALVENTSSPGPSDSKSEKPVPMSSVSRTTPPDVTEASGSAPSKPKPDMAAMRAAALAKKAGQTEPTNPVTPAEAIPTEATALPVKPKPDLAAMRAAALAKKAGQSEPANPVTPPEAIPTEAAAPPVKPKPDLAAMRAAALAKKAGQSEPANPVTPAEAIPTEAAAPPVKPKPDLAAMRAAALAKKAGQSEPANPVTPPDAIPTEAAAPPVKPKPDLAAMRAAALGKKDGQPVSAPVVQPGVKAKPDLAAMRAAALGKSPTVAPSPASLANAGETGKAPPIDPAPISKTPGPPPRVGSGSVPPPPAPPPLSSDQLNDFKKFYLTMIRPFLPDQKDTRTWKDGISRAVLASRVRSTGEHPSLASTLRMLQDYCEQRQQFALMMQYHRWLHGWLIIHIPCTVALYFILFTHVFMALRVIPIGN